MEEIMSSGVLNTQGPTNSSVSAAAQELDLTLYRHRVKSRVRSYDVDRQSIVHNAVYL